MRSLELLVTTVMMTTIPTVGLATSAQQSNLFALFGSLRPDVELRPEQGGWSLQYCPDNTCERFCCSTSKCDGSLLDFSFLYLSHISGYTVLSEFKRKEAPHATPGVLARHRASCHQSSERDAVVCILRDRRPIEFESRLFATMKANGTRRRLILRKNSGAQLNHEPANNALNPTVLRVTALADRRQAPRRSARGLARAVGRHGEPCVS